MTKKSRIAVLSLFSIIASPLPVEVRLEAPQGFVAEQARPATLVIRPRPGQNLPPVQALAIDPVDAEIDVTRPGASVTLDESDGRFRKPIAFQIPRIQPELRIPMMVRPKGREASALELFFLNFGERSSVNIAFQTLVVLEKTDPTRYETTSEPKYLKRRMESDSHSDPQRSTSRKRQDPTVERRGQ